MAHTVNVNFKLDEDVKKRMERACAEMGLSMSAAFTMFAKKVDPTLKPAAATKTVTTTTVTNTTATKASRPKVATATSSSLPKTSDSHWIAVSALLFVLGAAVLKAARRC